MLTSSTAATFSLSKTFTVTRRGFLDTTCPICERGTVSPYASTRTYTEAPHINSTHPPRFGQLVLLHTVLKESTGLCPERIRASCLSRRSRASSISNLISSSSHSNSSTSSSAASLSSSCSTSVACFLFFFLCFFFEKCRCCPENGVDIGWHEERPAKTTRVVENEAIRDGRTARDSMDVATLPKRRIALPSIVLQPTGVGFENHLGLAQQEAGK